VNELNALPSMPNHESKPLNLHIEISQSKLLELALHSCRKLARKNFSRPQ